MSKDQNNNTQTMTIEDHLREDHLRVEALGHGVRHRLSTETPEDVVEAAKKYFAFLKGE